MFHCQRCNSAVEPDRTGQYSCEGCGHQDFFLVDPIPEGGGRPVVEDEAPRSMVKMSPTPDQSEAEFIRLALSVVIELKDRGLSRIRDELAEKGELSFGPMFSYEAEGIKARALEVGVQADVRRR